ncbi:PilN family type IVB pilus formation outer membrane protein [Herbaspirillum huttiense]|uniref:PilN family type IVB pilus formation outer membrane protein n=1 Tax=Herbaspirillum huttiense TaxID=863372 RepID=UPI00380E91BF
MKSLAIALIIVSLSGCTLPVATRTNAKVDEQQAESSAQMASLAARTIRPQGRGVVELERQYVNLKPFRVKLARKEPAALKCTIGMRTEEPITILEFAQFVTKYCKVPVRVTADALAAIETVVDGVGNANGTGNATAVGNQASAQKLQKTKDEARLIDIKYKEAPLSGLLQLVTSRFGLSYKVEDDDSIKIYSVETKQYSFYAVNMEMNSNSSIQSGTSFSNGTSTVGSTSSSTTSGGSGSVGGNSSSSQTTEVSVKAKFWDDVKSTLQTTVSKRGTFSTAPSTGTITVTDSPDVLARVQEYVDNQNRILTKQVLFNIKVVRISASDNSNLNLNWSLVYKNLASKFGIGLKNSSGFATDNSVSGTINILQSSNFDGSSAVISALEEQTRNMQVITLPVPALNMRTTPIQIGEQTGFVASRGISQGTAGNTLSGTTQGQITSGFNSSVLPYVLDDNRIMVNFRMNLSDLSRLRVSTDGIEIPDLGNRIMAPDVVLKTGETLVLSGYESQQDNAGKAGVGSPNFIALGGGANAKRQRDTLIVLISAVLMD